MYFFFSSRRRHTRSKRDWSSDVCSSDLRPGCRGRYRPGRAPDRSSCRALAASAAEPRGRTPQPGPIRHRPAPRPLPRAGRRPASRCLPLPEAFAASSPHGYPEIPAAVQAALYLAVHSWEAGTNLSAMTVEFIFDVVTQVGVKSTDGTKTWPVVSIVVWPPVSAVGTWTPARTYIASAAAAWASR